MKTSKNRAWMLFISLLFLLILAACSNANDVSDNNSDGSNNENLEGGNSEELSADLSIYTDIGLSDEWFQKFVIDPVQEHFPNVTMKLYRKQSGTSPEDLIASGEFPDILYNSTPRMSTYKRLGLVYDMTSLIEKYDFDLSNFHEPALDAIKQLGDNGELYGVPFWLNFTVLYYNKDIFDLFAVPYPEDGMTWMETIELSERLTRTEDGTVYRGLDIHDMESFYSQLSQPYVDSETDTALLETDGFKKVYEVLLKLYQIPGNQERGSAKDAFLSEKTLAMWPMYADVPTWINDLLADGDIFHWDMAQMPMFEHRPGFAWQVDSHNLHVTSSSENKEAAFQVIQYLLSREPQLHLAKNGLLTSRVEEEYKAHFGQEMPIFEGKNVDAIFKSQPAPKYKMTPFDSIAASEFKAAFKEVEAGTMDINSALKMANEKANQRIQQEKM